MCYTFVYILPKPTQHNAYIIFVIHDMVDKFEITLFDYARETGVSVVWHCNAATSCSKTCMEFMLSNNTLSNRHKPHSLFVFIFVFAVSISLSDWWDLAEYWFVCCVRQLYAGVYPHHSLYRPCDLRAKTKAIQHNLKIIFRALVVLLRLAKTE